jgi:hypothetical protein
MLKVVKKYNKWILVVGGSLIMVLWLLPQGLTSFRDPRKRVIATMDGANVRANEMDATTRGYEAIKVLAASMGPQSPLPDLEAAFGVRSSEHYFLLATLAERRGLVGGKADADEIWERTIDALAVQQARVDVRGTGPEADRARKFMASFDPPTGVAADEIAAREAARQFYFDRARTVGLPGLRQNLGGRAGLNEEQLDHAMAVYRGVIRMIENYSSTARFSDRRVVSTARRFADRATLDYVLAGADRFIPGVPEPTTEEIAAHYEKYKAVEPGTGEFGIGYRKPDRVKLEWIEINRAKIAEKLTLIDTHVRETWNAENPGGTSEQFAKARPDFENSLKTRYAEDLIKLADARFREAAGEAARKYPAAGRFRTLPADWRTTGLSMKALADAITAGVRSDTANPDDRERWRAPVEFPEPLVNAETGWLDTQALGTLGGIGTSTLARGNDRIPFRQLALNVREFPAGKAFNPADALLQVGLIPVFDRSLSDFTGNHYYLRITAARPAGEPESLDEVKEQVVTDLKRIKAFDRLKAEVEKAGVASLTGGLEAAATTFTPLDAAIGGTPLAPLTVKRGLVVSKERVMGADAAALNVPAFRDAVAAKVASLDARLNLSAQAAEARTVWMPLPGSLSAVVARVEQLDPVTQELIRSADAGIVSAARNDELSDDGVTRWNDNSPFSLAALRKNLNYRSLGGDREEEPVKDAASTTPAPATPKS